MILATEACVLTPDYGVGDRSIEDSLGRLPLADIS